MNIEKTYSRKVHRDLTKKLWEILESYGALDHFKDKGEYMIEVRNKMLRELISVLYEPKKRSIRIKKSRRGSAREARSIQHKKLHGKKL